MGFLSLENVSKEYKTGAGSFLALSDVNFELNEGEFVIILGPSGAGKTTLLNLLGGMDDASGGLIKLDGQDVSSLNKKQLTQYRREKIGFVFQFYNLMPNLTALENVELATEICPNALNHEQTLENVVIMARSIAKIPKLLLCDEPTGALDYKTGKLILRLLYDISKKNNKLVIVVTHNQALKEMADKVISIKNGRIEKTEINDNPKPIEEIEW